MIAREKIIEAFEGLEKAKGVLSFGLFKSREAAERYFLTHYGHVADIVSPVFVQDPFYEKHYSLRLDYHGHEGVN